MGKGARLRQQRKVQAEASDFEMSREQRWYLRKEVEKEVAAGKKRVDEYFDNYALDMTSNVVWDLYNEFGFTESDIRLFVQILKNQIAEMKQFYEVDEPGTSWVCRQKLKDHGIDLEHWWDGEDGQV